MYGSDPLGPLSWRFLLDEAGHGVTTDLLSHAVDLAHMLLGPITRVVGTTETFIRERPVRRGRHALRRAAAPTTRAAPVTNEDYAGMLCEFAGGARGTFEASRTIVGPESQMAFDVYGTRGRAGLEPRAAERAAGLPRRGRAAHRLPDRVRRRPLPVPRQLRAGQRERDRVRGPRGDRGPRVLRSVAERRRHRPGFERGAARGCASRRRCCARRRAGAGRTSSR